MTACWLVALVGVSAVAAAVAQPIDDPLPRAASAETVVIGSSLMRSAFPPSMPSSQDLGIDGTLVRIGLPQAQRSDIPGLLAQAVDNGARRVLIEANPLLFTFNGDLRARDCADPDCMAQQFILHVRENGTHQIRRLLGLATRADHYRKAALEEPTEAEYRPRDWRASNPYPVFFHEPDPDGELASQIERAQAKGVDLVLLVTPRSPAASALMGQEQEKQIMAKARKLAAEHNMTIFAPEGDWQESDFTDNAHLSLTGRERFLRRLTAWWQAQQ